MGRFHEEMASACGGHGARCQCGSVYKSRVGFFSESHFVDQGYDLAILRPRSIVFEWVAAIVDGPRPLSEDLLMQLYTFPW